ncbi:carbohydrate ABC transporter permease [Paenibacillus eucommiae]|uniref:Aldouronate transport system permease protein n=1 Tax=Paenibacillus eucommiae TaxID=1355755 RepID=A0ABS4ITY3_9BACL|nr:carbohydrate ABC transporter permease [Paenibacillus eucommiae]MBP1991043.1 putative aldouronate transport system permease protein [Paenibacillus eucommiae]
MKYRSNVLERTATLLIYSCLILLSLLCIAPLIHILAVSFSSAWAAEAGDVSFWPVGFTLQSYEFVFHKPQFLNSLVVSLKRVVLGVTFSMVLTVMAAYPLSKEARAFRFRTVYAWVFVFTILFSGGLIPWYMTIRTIGLLDSIWALVLPGAVPVFNIILLLNFFRNLPKELEESAFVDGAQHWTILFKIFIPLSKPALATLTLFCVVGQWNSWFDGLILMNSPDNYPLSSYLQTVVIGRDLSQMTAQEVLRLSETSNRTFKAAQIFLGALPVLLLYPFLQKYFAKGIVLGSVKG